ncbi:uncharacterized protein LOC119606262 isoform X2 [Lucilia sericata]|uniref:uncharacterized protein LOC119606262 isoform X2 n=1 Tax=Lucilia sericata TaxID=13632 RepID=UPI0018A8272B|nr:uncharacterized protein LOC119606262 isoform X2 [Lucilia sericata]
MKTKSLYFCVLAFVLCFTTVTAQRECRMYMSYIRQGQRVCQRICLPSPQIRCYTSRFGERMFLCPPDCCRVGNTCRPPLIV